jgi:hypothetical protein
MSGLELLATRREVAIGSFANKCLNGRFSHWFPLNDAATKTRKSLRFKEEFARCDRLKNSPIYYMRRVLNRQFMA